MMSLLIGILSFITLIIYDYVKLHSNNRAWNLLFVLGTLALVGATAGIVPWNDLEHIFTINPVVKSIDLVMFLLFFILLIDTLFFALPFQDVYTKNDTIEVIHTGVYALCRHPGVLWFGGSYLFLWTFCGGVMLFIAFIIFTAMDILYVYLQDRFIFPKSMNGYQRYQQTTPFLIPNKRSIVRCFKTQKRR